MRDKALEVLEENAVEESTDEELSVAVDSDLVHHVCD